MRLLADESCAGPVIRALRSAGHDVSLIAESAKGSSDEVVIARASGEARVLITEDRVRPTGFRTGAYLRWRHARQVSQQR